MPRCGGILELFPPGYYVLAFFVPLASTSGLPHGFIYTGANRTVEWDESGIHMLELRTAARSLDLCAVPPFEVTVKSD